MRLYFHFVEQTLGKNRAICRIIKAFLFLSVSYEETNGKHPPFSAYLSCGYCSTKTQKPIGKNIIELPRSVTKGLVACRDTA